MRSPSSVKCVSLDTDLSHRVQKGFVLVESLGVFIVALLYSVVGHAGASGYLALFTLLGRAPAEIRPLALALNLVVSVISVFQFIRAGHLSLPRFQGVALPLILGALPFAFFGSALKLPLSLLKGVLGAVLLFSALRLVWTPEESEPRPAPRREGLVGVGVGVGFLAGLSGTGGGIFLSPLLLLLGWARTRETAAISSLFIQRVSGAKLCLSAPPTSLYCAERQQPGERSGLFWEAGRLPSRLFERGSQSPCGLPLSSCFLGLDGPLRSMV
jgi:uncharacterized protein